MRALPHRTLRASAVVVTFVGLAVTPGSAAAATKTFSYTGGEQTYTVPAGVTTLYVTATGAHGGGPTSGTSLLPGRGAVVAGKINVTPGDTLYVEVGGAGSNPQGGFNGGGDGGDQVYISAPGGGGASDVRTIARGLTGSLDSRLIVAGGGGGSGYPAAGGGNAGQPGFGYPDLAAGGGAGTAGAGGAGGCTSDNLGCGSPGTKGAGGTGGFSGDGFFAREGAGGGGGRFGGGGGAGVSGAVSGAVGGGGGGSSLAPGGGAALLAPTLSTPASVVISTKVPKYTAYEIPVYLCVNAPDAPAGTLISMFSYIDKGGGDVHLEGVPVGPTFPAAAGWSFTISLNGVPIDTFTVAPDGTSPPLELKGDDVPPLNGALVITSAIEVAPGQPGLTGFVIASSVCNPAA